MSTTDGKDQDNMSITQTAPEDTLICDLPGCFTSFPEADRSIVIDKNGHNWYVCPSCIDGMWARKPWTAPEDAPREDSVITRSAYALPELVGSLHILVDSIHTTDPGTNAILRRMYDELNKAREVYTPNV